jgi:hypothetical protein
LALSPTALRSLRDLPIETPANPLKQFPIVQPQHRLARFAIDNHPAPLRARVRRYSHFFKDDPTMEMIIQKEDLKNIELSRFMRQSNDGPPNH